MIFPPEKTWMGQRGEKKFSYHVEIIVVGWWMQDNSSGRCLTLEWNHWLRAWIILRDSAPLGGSIEGSRRSAVIDIRGGGSRQVTRQRTRDRNIFLNSFGKQEVKRLGIINVMLYTLYTLIKRIVYILILHMNLKKTSTNNGGNTTQPYESICLVSFKAINPSL